MSHHGNPPDHPMLPDKQPTLRVVATQMFANPAGDVFGGWLMSQIDLAASIHALEYAQGPAVTVSVNYLQFEKPIYVGDLVSFYANMEKVGTSSMQIKVEVYAQRAMKYSQDCAKVADAKLTFVAVAKPGITRKLPEYKG